MKELEFWVVRYPWSARPWKNGNSFIFGHSSNFPWIAGKYNDVFARLWQMEKWDTIYSYYGQKKYKYKIIEKKVVSPNDVGVLKNDKNKKQLTLMTCWPIGTDINRLILIADLVEVK
jgi:sortase A